MEFQEGKHDLARRGLPEVDATTVDGFLGAADGAGAVAVLLSAAPRNPSTVVASTSGSPRRARSCFPSWNSIRPPLTSL